MIYKSRARRFVKSHVVHLTERYKDEVGRQRIDRDAHAVMGEASDHGR